MKKLFLALPFLLAGCQAERVAFQFQPVAPTAAPAPRATQAAVAASAALAPTEAPAALSQPALTERLASSPAPSPAPQPWQPVAAHTTTAPRLLAPETLPALRPTATPSRLPWAGRLALRPLLRQPAGPARTAENGLGGIALFFIAVLLGVLAGLGALVSVIFGTGFFTGMGFAAAGLVVLFLLYSLLSGGKKKPKPAK